MPEDEPFIYDLALKIEKERDLKKIRVLADRLLQLLEKISEARNQRVARRANVHDPSRYVRPSRSFPEFCSLTF
jgi:hypothetical protein